MNEIDWTKLTPQEAMVLRVLGEAWNGFINLPPIHADDQTEFRRAIHAAQNIVLARAAYREHPTE